jgi:hypothetical protein
MTVTIAATATPTASSAKRRYLDDTMATASAAKINTQSIASNFIVIHN